MSKFLIAATPFSDRLQFPALVALLALAHPGLAETYPDHAVRIVNPFPPGGSVDVMARMLAQKLSEELGQQFIVETRAGAGGNTGSESVAKSEPDGYTLLFTAPGPLVVNPTLYTNPGYDPRKDFDPIGLIGELFPPIVLPDPLKPINGIIGAVEDGGTVGVELPGLEAHITLPGLPIPELPDPFDGGISIITP